MKTLYRINVLHAAPKDNWTNVETYLLASNDEAVAEFINKEYQYGDWFDDEFPDEEDRDEDWESEWQVPDPNGEEYDTLPVNKREYIMHFKGMLEDGDFSDAYYGITKYGWEYVAEVQDELARYLVELGIAKEVSE